MFFLTALFLSAVSVFAMLWGMVRPADVLLPSEPEKTRKHVLKVFGGCAGLFLVVAFFTIPPAPVPTFTPSDKITVVQNDFENGGKIIEAVVNDAGLSEEKTAVLLTETADGLCYKSAPCNVRLFTADFGRGLYHTWLKKEYGELSEKQWEKQHYVQAADTCIGMLARGSDHKIEVKEYYPLRTEKYLRLGGKGRESTVFRENAPKHGQ